jgi:hypothetical protein
MRKPRGKLTDEQVEEIRALHRDTDCPQWQIAEKYGVTQSHVSRVLHGKTKIGSSVESALPQGDDIVSMADIARRLGLLLPVVSKWRQKGVMPPHRYSERRHQRWSWAIDIEPWLRATHRLGEFDDWPDEIWAVISTYPRYEVSTLGRVRRIAGGRGARPGRPLKPRPGRGGYLTVALYTDDGFRCDAYVHHLVLEAFVSLKPSGMETCHRNSDQTDNRLSNLRWGTPESNAQDKINARLARGCDCGRPFQWNTNSEGKRSLRCVYCYRAKKRARYHANKRSGVNG